MWAYSLVPVLFEGIVSGVITLDRSGTSGFGYDPVFLPDGYSKTFAEMTMDEKNKLSHRAQAVKKLEAYLANAASIHCKLIVIWPHNLCLSLTPLESLVGAVPERHFS